MPELEQMPEAHMFRAYGVYLLKTQHRLIRQLKKRYQPSVHGHRTWKSSYLLMDYLLENPIRKGAPILEIGCGWGAASVFCAARFKARVTGSDIDREVFPYVDLLAELNDVRIATLRRKFEKISGAELGGFHTVIGADICFWDSLVKPLYHLVNRALRNGAQRFVIADPGRPTFYEFVDLCRKRHRVDLMAWYAVEPERFEGEVVDIRPA